MNKHGICECDAPDTAHEVRLLASCAHCGSLGKRLIKTPGGAMHVVCAMRSQPAAKIARAARERARLCCLMTFANGDVDKARTAFDILTAFGVQRNSD